jgi:D-glycero-alpha-D-manno-heptose-7-phosphate kinase
MKFQSHIKEFEIFTISLRKTIREALLKIEENHLGLIIALNDNGSVAGLATDGDIRRQLLNGVLLTDHIELCINRNFVFAISSTPRELMLKQLDNKIKAIPILGNVGELVDICHRGNLPALAEDAIYVHARSPVRISFGGGGSDVTNFFYENFGAVINATLKIYSHATLRKRDDLKVIIHSMDLDDSLEVDRLDDLFLVDSDKFRLIKAVLKTIQPDFGFNLYLSSDFPMQSGLGGSAVISAAILGCFNQFRVDRWNAYEISQLAFQAERLLLGIAGGWQDQYATVFGGFNFMEFNKEGNLVHPLRINENTLMELEENLVLCDTGVIHDSGSIHKDQAKNTQRVEIKELVIQSVGLTYRMREYLLKGDLISFGNILNDAWNLKKQFSPGITNSYCDSIYSDAIAHGAIGGKLMGAGGGGFFIFYASPFRKHELINKLRERGLKVRPVYFEDKGLSAWAVRDAT